MHNGPPPLSKDSRIVPARVIARRRGNGIAFAAIAIAIADPTLSGATSAARHEFHPLGWAEPCAKSFALL
jgi:hypothetical protein